MATINGDNYDVAVDFDPSADDKLVQGLWNGKVRVQMETYTINAKAAGTVINVAKLPKGATFIRAAIDHQALGGSVTLAMGDSATDDVDADRYLVATSAATAGSIAANAYTGVGYTALEDLTIDLTTAGGTTAAADRVIKVSTIFSLE